MVTPFLRIVTPRYLCLLRHVPIVFGNLQSVVFTFFRLKHEGVVVFGSFYILTVADFRKKNFHADETVAVQYMTTSCTDTWRQSVTTTSRCCLFVCVGH